MALIVETGIGMSTAESLCSVADANIYHKAMGNDAWADLDTPLKEAYLRRATRFMQSQYRSRWQGQRTLRTQALDWPRYGVVVDNETIDNHAMPREVVNACAEFALRAATGALLPDAERRVLSESVGTLSVTYDPHGPQNTRYVEIEGLLAPFFGAAGGSSMMKLVRS